MKSLIVAAVATFALGGAALAASSPGSNWYSGTASKTTPVASETCTGAKARYEAAMKAHPSSPSLKAAAAKAKTASTACASGKTATGVADYQAATKLLGS
jgi:hypothetical protein